jgi:glycyl-tRNA synthetase beta chain
MNKYDFLVEIGCEELPPKSLANLASALLNGIEQGLCNANIFPGKENTRWYAAPRRLAVYVDNLIDEQPEIEIERRGPAMNAAYDANGQPSKALQGFARSCDVEINQLQTLKTDKGEWFYYKSKQPGKKTIELLPGIVNDALKLLPIPKPMRWGENTVEFIRPVHWVVMLYGIEVVPATVLGKMSDRFTYGHRFHYPDKIELQHANAYLEVLRKHKVIADFSERKKLISQAIDKKVHDINGRSDYSDALLDEVTAIVEWPEVLLANFDPRFLKVPQEALISAMQGHQKSFPVFDQHHKLLPHFIFVANIASKNPNQVIKGNQKVMHARLSDAAFFYETDLKTPLIKHVDALKNVVFQDKLGSLYDRSQRIAALAKVIASQLGVDPKQAEHAALLAKCDLMTNMVYEFPELQGIMGRYYAEKNGEAKDICEAIVQHYLPAGSGDKLPENPVAICVALADKIDLLVSIFSIGKKPTGDKDPFALRRAAIGVIRILLSLQVDLAITTLVSETGKQLSTFNATVASEVESYLLDRLKYYYLEQGEDVALFNAVNSVTFSGLPDFAKRLAAVKNFTNLAEAKALAEANKRVKNILSKQNAKTLTGDINVDLLSEKAEANLFDAIQQQKKNIKPLLAEKNYQAILQSLASLQPVVDQFFTDVMVMVDDNALRNNRLLLLNQLRDLFLTVADISQLN